MMYRRDKVAQQPSMASAVRDVLYEIMRWRREFSRQMAVISNWTGLSKIGNVRSCRAAYYLPEATEWDPILVPSLWRESFIAKDRITQRQISIIFQGTNQPSTV